MKIHFRLPLTSGLSIACCLLLVLGSLPGKLFAVVDDAHSFALEAADPWVRQGVSVRYEYASGTFRSGGSARVGYQVFRGNEYWLFAGGNEDGSVMSIKVMDSEGTEITGKHSRAYNSATFQFTPERTMLVVVEISGRVRGTAVATMDWALVYGYRSAQAPAGDPGDADAAGRVNAVEEETDVGEVSSEAADDLQEGEEETEIELPEEEEPAGEPSTDGADL